MARFEGSPQAKNLGPAESKDADDRRTLNDYKAEAKHERRDSPEGPAAEVLDTAERRTMAAIASVFQSSKTRQLRRSLSHEGRELLCKSLSPSPTTPSSPGRFFAGGVPNRTVNDPPDSPGGAGPAPPRQFVGSPSRSFRLSRSISSEVDQYLRSGDLQNFQRKVKTRKDARHVDFIGESRLLKAARSGQAHIVRYLIECEADLDHTDPQGCVGFLFVCCSIPSPTLFASVRCSSLFYAAWNGYLDIVNVLLRAGANPDIQTKTKATALIQVTVLY